MCKDEHLFAGLKPLIDRVMHRFQSIWEDNSNEGNWIFLLVDEKNSFNEIHRIIMLWMVRHLWTTVARFF